MYAVGAELPFPGWFFENFKNEYYDSTLLMSLTEKHKVHFYSDIEEAVSFAKEEWLELHSSPRTGLPLGLRAIFEVSGEEDTSGNLCIKKIKKVCLPNAPDEWKKLNFDTSKSVYENAYTLESYIYPFFYSDRINLQVPITQKVQRARFLTFQDL